MLNDIPKSVKRCVIYTRKSSEKGMDIEYTSLASQYDDCVKYIRNKETEGFVLLPNHYEDVGISGKSMDNRPAFQAMLKEIRAGNIDCIVVYKIDRLSRSLLDFAKLMETLTKHEVDFISVTQQFDTSTAAGKLMLNILFSFAQFEREITSERMKDKINNSRMKGRWTGGPVPLGYLSEDRKLVTCEEDAQTVRLIFNQFTQSHSINAVVRYLNTNNIKTKTGGMYDISMVKRIIENPIYIGKIPHRGLLYKGLHDAIVDIETWENAVAILKDPTRLQKSRKIVRNVETRKSEPSLLMGMIFCGECKTAMTPVYSKKRNITYRYYLCCNHQKKLDTRCPIKRISAGQLENLVLNEMMRLLKSESIFKEVAKTTAGVTWNDVAHCFESIEETWEYLFTAEKYRLVKEVIDKVVVYKYKIEINLRKSGMQTIFAEIMGSDKFENCTYSEGNDNYQITIPYEFKVAPSLTKIIRPLDKSRKPLEHYSSNNLAKFLALAWKWKNWLESDEYKNLEEIATVEGLDHTYVLRGYRFNYLAPDIVTKLLDGDYGDRITVHSLGRMIIPDLWEDQRQLFGL